MTVVSYIFGKYDEIGFPQNILGDEISGLPDNFKIFESRDSMFERVSFRYAGDKLAETTYVFKSKDFSIQELLSDFSNPSVNYSFRDNLTRITFEIDKDYATKIYVDFDNKIELLTQGEAIEQLPNGQQNNINPLRLGYLVFIHA